MSGRTRRRYAEQCAVVPQSRSGSMFAFLGLDANRIGPQPLAASPPSRHVFLTSPAYPAPSRAPPGAVGTTAIRRIPPPAPLPPSLDPSITGSGSLERSLLFATSHPSSTSTEGVESVVETLKRLAPSPPRPERAKPNGPRDPHSPFIDIASLPLPPGALRPDPPSPRSSPQAPIVARPLPAFRLDDRASPVLQGTFSQVRQSRFLYDDRDLPPLPPAFGVPFRPLEPMLSGREGKIPDPKRTVKGPGNSVFRNHGMWDLLGLVSGRGAWVTPLSEQAESHGEALGLDLSPPVRDGRRPPLPRPF